MRGRKEKSTGNFRRVLYYFWKALMQHKVMTAIIIVLMPVRMLINSIVLPWGGSEIIGMLSQGDYELAHYQGILIFQLAALFIEDLVIVRILDWVDWSLDAKCGEYLSKLAFDAVINQSMTFHSNRFSGSLTSAANKFAGAFIDLKSNFVWDMYPLALSVIYTVVAAFVTCPAFALILILFTITYTIVATVSYRKTLRYDEQLADAENKQTGQLADSITNELNIKAYAREDFERYRFARATRRTHDATIGTAKASFRRGMSCNLVESTSYALILLLVVFSHDWFGISVASVVFLWTVSNTLMTNVWSINHILRTINRSFSNAKEMAEILDLPYIIDDKTDKPLVVTEATIDFRHITFNHEKQKEKLFQDFTLTIPSGQRVGLVGVSGSGKTTLTKLLLRFDDVKKGAIYVDGQDIRDVTQKSLREAISYVPQESSLFHRSIYENIAYGKVGATQSEVVAAAKLANADEFIRKLPDGYDTMVGERGIKLSGGQRQRIAIARAILKDAPILVLDEATSALDSESEAAIQEALANLMRGRTSIVVAHRLSTIAGLDEIVVLNDGKIVEHGSHQELLAKNGEYAKLWSRQSGAFLEES